MTDSSNFAVPARCAVKDADFVATFRTNRFLPGKIFFNGTEKVERGTGGVGGATLKFPARIMPWDKVRCPYCGAPLFVHCSGCGAFVCKGRVTGNFFRCSESCGTAGLMQVTDVEVTALHRASAAVRLRLSSRTGIGQAGGVDTPRLPAPPLGRLPRPKGSRP